jgi:dihydrofolate reductase
MDVNDGDTFFEVPDAASWKEVERTPGSEGDITFNFVTLERK